MTELEGKTILHIEIKVPVSEFLTWDVARIERFFLGLVQALNARFDRMENP